MYYIEETSDKFETVADARKAALKICMEKVRKEGWKKRSHKAINIFRGNQHYGMVWGIAGHHKGTYCYSTAGNSRAPVYKYINGKWVRS